MDSTQNKVRVVLIGINVDQVEVDPTPHVIEGGKFAPVTILILKMIKGNVNDLVSMNTQKSIM